MSVNLDEATQVRPGEELPLDSLQGYLRTQFPDLDGPLTVEQFPSGHSNLTYLLHLGNGEFVLRREPFENPVKSAHDMGREYRVLSKLSLAYPPAPRPVLFCDDPSVLGVPFYLMERRRGLILRSQTPPDIAIDPPLARRLSESLIDNLAKLHALDVQQIGLGDLGRPEGYTTRQVSGWSDRWTKARTGELPVMEQVARWLTERVPEPAGAVLIHNDYKYDNLVLDPQDPSRIVAVLDWEMATVGCPLMDLGTTLGYWVEAGDPSALRRSAMGPTALPGNLTRRELVERYVSETGRDVSGILFHYVFGLFKIGVIVQQIYARYVRGHTRDPRFASLDRLVSVLAEQAERSIAVGRV
jgi:aminoglycoside phosphotransferase (APT) family kinase protein